MAFMTQPDKLLEIDWPGTGTWTDITGWWLAPEGISISRGRTDELGTVTAGRAAFTLDNSDGRFTAGRAASPYYPNVKLNRQVRFLIAWVPGKNYLPNPGFETDAAGWTSAARSTTRANTGAASGLIHNGTGSTATVTATILIAGLTVGNTYTCSAKVWQPAAGSAPAKLGIAGLSAGSNSSGTAAWVTPGAYTFTATARYHTLQVIVTSLPNGGDLWVDDVQVEDGGSATSFDGANPAWVGYRFTGFVQGWPVQWAPVGKWAQASITAADRFAQFGERITWKSLLTEQTRFALADPAGYYLLDETSGSTSAASIGSRTDLPALTPAMVGTGGTGVIAPGGGTGPGTDQATTLQFQTNSGSTTDFVYMSGKLSQTIDTSTWCAQFWFNATVVSGTADQSIVVIEFTNGDIIQFRIGQTDGALYARRLGRQHAVVVSFWSVSQGTPGPVMADGHTHHVLLTENFNGTGQDINLYVDGTLVSFRPNITTYTAAPISTIYLAGNPAFLPVAFPVMGYTGTVAHLAISNTLPTSGQITDIYNAGVNGLSGDLPAARISRLLDYVDPTIVRRLDAGQSTIGAQATDGSSPLSAMQAVEQAEGGVYFIAGDGAAVLHGRARRYQVTGIGRAELDADQYGADLQPVLDNQHIVNEMVVTIPGGGIGSSRSPASKTAYGLYRQTPSLPLANTTDAAGLAQNTVGLYSEPALRIPAVSVDLYTQPSLYSTVLPLDVSSGIYLKNLPGQAASSNVDLVVEGYTEKIAATGWDISFNLTPASLYQVFQLDVSPYNQLDAANRLVW